MQPPFGLSMAGQSQCTSALTGELLLRPFLTLTVPPVLYGSGSGSLLIYDMEHENLSLPCGLLPELIARCLEPKSVQVSRRGSWDSALFDSEMCAFAFITYRGTTFQDDLDLKNALTD